MASTRELDRRTHLRHFVMVNFENQNKSTPYFSFGGMYYRRGTGYFEQDDLYAEEMEMKQVIDDLLRE